MYMYLLHITQSCTCISWMIQSAKKKKLANATKPPNPSYPWIHHLTVAKQLQHLDPTGPGSTGSK